MNKLYAVFALITPPFLLVSFSTNPPDGKTGAPGDGLCIECHIQQNPPIDGTISVEGFPASVTPLETYLLTVVNRNTVGDAVRAGFQMTILGPVNTKAGNMSMPSASSIVTDFGGRQYFEHNPAVLYPDSNVVKWTVEWTAPDMPGGSQITWYVAGNIANGNFQEVGDRIVTANGSGVIMLASSDKIAIEKPAIYPNPGDKEINIVLPDVSRADGHVIFFDFQGRKISETELYQGIVKVPDQPSGVYLLEIKQGDNSYFSKWIKL